MRFDSKTKVALPIVAVLMLAGLIFGVTKCNAQTYTGWSYDAQTDVLTLEFDFPGEAVKALQLAGGLGDAKAIADKMGKQAAEGFRNVVSSATESMQDKKARYFDAVASPTQKQAFKLWADTVGTFERENPPDIGMLMQIDYEGHYARVNPEDYTVMYIGKSRHEKFDFMRGWEGGGGSDPLMSGHAPGLGMDLLKAGVAVVAIAGMSAIGIYTIVRWILGYRFQRP